MRVKGLVSRVKKNQNRDNAGKKNFLMLEELQNGFVRGFNFMKKCYFNFKGALGKTLEKQCFSGIQTALLVGIITHCNEDMTLIKVCLCFYANERKADFLFNKPFFVQDDFLPCTKSSFTNQANST